MAQGSQRKKGGYDALKYLSHITQLGISLVVPILFCIWLANFLGSRYGLSQGWQLLLVLWGVGGAVSNLIKFFRYAYREARESAQREGEE